MDFFALLELPRRFDLDVAALESAYFALQRQYHPDRFVGRPHAERQRALHASVDINQAYRALKDPLRRAQHLLALQGVHVGGQRDTVRPSQALLAQSLDLRERLEEAENAQALAALAREAEDIKSACEQALGGLIAGAKWEQAAQETLRLGYLQKLEEDVAQKHRVMNKNIV